MAASTESVCPICLKHIEARYAKHPDGSVYLEKVCPEHGETTTLVWGPSLSYEGWAKGSEHASALNPLEAPSGPCIENCGLCGRHEGDTCIAVVHLTNACDLACPVCFAQANSKAMHEPTIEELSRMFSAIAAKPLVPTVQLSGGEPTCRADLLEIIRMAKAAGVRQLLLNTNGKRIAAEQTYARALFEAGLDTVYLQFDGTRETDYLALRGCNLLETKIKAIDACARAGLGVVLVPTVYPGINEDNLGGIVEFAKKRMPTVKGIHFQPVSYFGRVPKDAPLDARRVTLPDVIAALEEQTQGEIPASAMLPRRKYDAHCSFSSVFLLSTHGRLAPITGADSQPSTSPEEFDFDIYAKEAIDFADKYWRTELAESKTCCCGGESKSFAQALLDRTLVISGMHFQDAYTFDFARLRGCCVHVVKPDGRFVPLCAEYLTAADGTPYRDSAAASDEKAS